ncbi:SUMF1/EgtB/PvdO family nonheme iron enzyme [bacterium]|nr:SUMF1/EgtB/PvdO family nonheme iron enzyme [bacterium]
MKNHAAMYIAAMRLQAGLLPPSVLSIRGPKLQRKSIGVARRAATRGLGYSFFVALLLNATFIAPLWAAEKAGDVVVTGIGLRMAYVPAGEFLMGAPFDDRARMADELPHKVTLTRPFRISTTEVTQRQWRDVMDGTPSRFTGDDLPVEMISWRDAVEFCRRLSDRQGKTYRLPTEAEWEYACRADGRRPGRDLDAWAWYAGNSDGKTHPVAGKRANRWGLHDMLGNVAEWCMDYYGPYPDAAVVADPTGAVEGSYRVVRGGSWLHFAAACRPSARMTVPESYQLPHVGLRVVEELRP